MTINYPVITYPVLPWYRESFLRYNIHIVDYATAEPLSLSQAQQHLRLDLYGSPLSHPDDSLIEDIYLPAAREYCESFSGRALVYQHYELRLRDFPREQLYGVGRYIPMPLGPVRMVTSIVYSDGNDVDQTLSEPGDYVLDPYTDGGRIYPAPGADWPSVKDKPNAVRVRFYAGYDPDGSSPLELPMPRQYQAAILLMLGHYYENRAQTEIGSSVPREIEQGVANLLRPSSLRRGFA